MGGMSDSEFVPPIVVVSDTHYGTTTDYATEFARLTGGFLVEGESGKSPQLTDELGTALSTRPTAPVVVFTPNYAGSFGGANLIKTVARANPDRKLALAVIGMTLLEEAREKDPARAALDDVSERVQRHYLPGRMLFSAMSRKHRAMLWVMTRMIKGKANPSPNEEQIVDAYGKDTDRVDFAELDALVEWLNEA